MMSRQLRLAALFLAAAGILAAGIEGRVVEDHTGNPLASVEVRIAKIGQRTLAAHLETDSSGQFRAPNLAPGEYRVDAAKPNFIGATLRLAALPGPLTIRLVRCAVITGQVLDSQGQPVLGATVYAMPKPPEGPLMPYSQPTPGTYTRVGERGQYRLHNLPPGEYAVVTSYGASTAAFGSSGGAEGALLQSALLALVSGSGEGSSPTEKLTGLVGLDELSVRKGDTDTKETIVSIGKQISQRWYVGYERSLNATAGSWQLVYKLAKSFTIRGQAGVDENAIDFIWTWRW